MAIGPLRDTNSPLSADQAERLNQALTGLEAYQLTWISGYLAGLSATAQQPVSAPSAAAGEAFALVILYGSQTGNAEGIAKLALERAKTRGFEARLADMAEFSKKDFKAPANYLIVVSTQGEGDPPDTAEGFFELINGRKAPDLKGSRFAVLGLGDSSYEHFCQMGKLTDARFSELGAERILDRVDCDVDFDQPAEQWIEATLDAYQTLKGESQAPQPAAGFATPTAAAAPSVHSRKHPFQAEVLESIQLNGRGSLKETHHIELSLEGSGLSYQPGDALGIVPYNDPGYVDEMLDILAMDAEHDLGAGRLLRDALLKELEVTTLTRPFVKHWAELSDASELKRLLGEDAKDELRAWLHGRQLIDVVRDYPVTGLDAPAFVSALRKLPPRLYSIASALDANPDEVHLTVGIVRYQAHGRARGGVTSTWLADRVRPGDTVPIYIEHNKNFKLPESNDTPIIMVGPGTGIAPFRSFMQQREEEGAKGASWLFFGDQHFDSDFLYQAEWLHMRAKGRLTRLDVAFSRDQAEKIYVQDRMREKGRELYEWLDNGAHFYVCGDGERMAVDVHNTLIEIAKTHGGRDEASATAWLRELQQAKRYQRDVY